jgi:hypothetical protein
MLFYLDLLQVKVKEIIGKGFINIGFCLHHKFYRKATYFSLETRENLIKWVFNYGYFRKQPLKLY